MQSSAATATTLSPVRPLRTASIFLAVASLVLIMPFVADVGIYTNVAFMAFLVVAPAWFQYQRGHFDAFEMIHVLGFRYFVFFGLGAVFMLQDPGNVAYDKYLLPYLPRATLYCMLGYVALLCGYIGPWFRKRAPRQFEEFPRGVALLLVPGLMGLAGSLAEAAMAYFFWLGGAIPRVLSSLTQLAPLFHFSWALCWMLIFSGRATSRQKVVALGVFVPATGLILAVSMADKSLAMTLLGIPLIALWYARRRLPWKTLIVLVLVLIFVIFPFFNTYRLVDPRLPKSVRMTMTMETIRHWDAQEFYDHSIGIAQRRVALINSVAVVLRDVPRWVPYLYGKSIFMPAVAFFIPHMLWPDKPSFTMGRDFGETFRVVSILDERTSVAVTVPGELFWNFDLPGILIGMALWGVLLRFFYRRYGEAEGLDPVRRAFHVVLLIQFVHFGGGLAGQFVVVARTLIMLEAFRWLATNMRLIEMRPVVPIRPGGGRSSPGG